MRHLAAGILLYFPGAFDAASLEKIEAAYAADKRIVVSELEATQFGCNVINCGRDILMGAVETDLAKRLMERGFEVTELAVERVSAWGWVGQGSGASSERYGCYAWGRIRWGWRSEVLDVFFCRGGRAFLQGDLRKTCVFWTWFFGGEVVVDCW